jgi:membrane-bound serine protease (ClpP class)
LRPAGVALVNGRRVDVVTEGGLIAAGARVKVVAIEGNRVVVRRVQV